MNDEQEELLVHVLRKNNRALRAVNKQIRRALKNAKEHSDEIFLALCEKDENYGHDDLHSDS